MREDISSEPSYTTLIARERFWVFHSHAEKLRPTAFAAAEHGSDEERLAVRRTRPRTRCGVPCNNASTSTMLAGWFRRVTHSREGKLGAREREFTNIDQEEVSR